MNTKEIIDVLDFKKTPVKVLLISGSPRSEKLSRSHLLYEEARKLLVKAEGVDLLEYSFTRKKIVQCQGCTGQCFANEECIIQDDFQAFRDIWLQADAVIWSAPVYHMGPPSLIRAALNRLNEVAYQTSQKHGQTSLPRSNLVVGAIIQGGSRFGGQEITLLWFIKHTLQWRGIWVSADMPESYHGVAHHTTTPEDLLSNKSTLEQTHALVQRVVEMAKIVKAGMLLAGDSLPDEYFPSQKKVGVIER